MDVKPIGPDCLDRIRKLGLPGVEENNAYVVLSVRGDGVRASQKWNARVYKDNRGRLKLVTVDLRTLQDMLEGRAPAAKSRTIAVDDAGWGFPIGGVLIGASDGRTIETGLVPAEFFQGESFERREYLGYAAAVTIELLGRFDARADDTLVEICTGYVNIGSKEALRAAGYEVNVVEVTGPLQDGLERRFAEYARSLGYPGYVDPKQTHDSKARFEDVMRWVMESPEERLKLSKTGWKYFKK